MVISSLKNNIHFNLVNKQGIKLYGPYFLLVLAKDYVHIPGNSPAAIAFGIKVSKRLGNAVIRNKIKRRIRHLIRLISKSLKSPTRLGLIFIPKQGFERLDFALIYGECQKLLTSKNVDILINNNYCCLKP